MRNLIITPHPVLAGDQIEKNEKVGKCSTYGEKREIYRDLEDASVDGDNFNMYL